MMKGRCCETCLFSGVSIVRGHKALTCHRYAPRPLNGGSGEGWADYEWPIIAPEDFCGEWAITTAHEAEEAK